MLVSALHPSRFGLGKGESLGFENTEGLPSQDPHGHGHPPWLLILNCRHHWWRSIPLRLIQAVRAFIILAMTEVQAISYSVKMALWSFAGKEPGQGGMISTRQELQNGDVWTEFVKTGDD